MTDFKVNPDHRHREPMRRFVSNTCIVRGWELLPGERLIGNRGGPDPEYTVHGAIVRITKPNDADRERWKKLYGPRQPIATVAHLDDKRTIPVGLYDLMRVALPRPEKEQEGT